MIESRAALIQANSINPSDPRSRLALERVSTIAAVEQAEATIELAGIMRALLQVEVLKGAGDLTDAERSALSNGIRHEAGLHATTTEGTD